MPFLFALPSIALRAARPLCAALAVAFSAACLPGMPAHAHGTAARMLPLQKTLEDFGATVRWDAYANVYTIARNSTVVRVRPGAHEALVNGRPLRLSVPIVLRGGQPYVAEPEGKNYTIAGNTLRWRNWQFHVRLDSRVGLMLSTVTYNDKGTPRKILYEGSLGGMIVPYGDPDTGWYFKAYLDSGEYGMGTLTSPIQRGQDAPANAVLLDATLADYTGAPRRIPNAIAVFERYAGPEYKHQEMGRPNLSAERRELVVRWISTVGNYDYLFDWVFSENGTIGIDAGATGIEAVKGVRARTMQDATAAEDTRYGTLIDHHIVGTTHQHLYNFRLDLDVDGERNTFTEIDPVVLPNTRGGPRTSTMQTVQRSPATEQRAAQKFDPSTIRLLSNPGKVNKMGNPVSYQLIPYAGGTHPIARGANFADDEWLKKRLGFMDRQLWVTRYDPDERFPEGKYPNRAGHDTGLGAFVRDDQSIADADDVVWLTTGTTHVARAEEWPIMPTEWVHVLLKPWNFFDETPTLGLDRPGR